MRREGFIGYCTMVARCVLGVALSSGPVAADGVHASEPDKRPFSLLAVLRHEKALCRPHDIEVRGKLAFVAGKGGSLAILDVSDPEAPELVWWKHDPRRLQDAQTVLPFGRHLFLGARHFFSLRIDGPGRAKIEEQVTDRPRIDRINGMVRREHHVFTANKNGWISVFDVSRPADPALHGALNTRKRGGVISPHDVALFQDCLVVVDQARGTSAHLRIYRVFDAETGRLRPVEQWEVGGAVGRDDLTGANRVVVSGGHAFLACSKSDPDNFTLGVIDLSDPGRPRHLATLPFAGVHSTGLTVAGRVLFAAGGRSVQVLDISDPESPKTLAVFRSERLFPTGRDNAHDLVYRDGLLYLTAQNDDRIGIVRIHDKHIRSLIEDPSP